MQRRHSYYIDSRLNRTAAAAPNVAIAGELGMRLIAEEGTSPASCLSSLRLQPVMAVISEGQTTRLKFALCDISLMLGVSEVEMSTLEMMHL